MKGRLSNGLVVWVMSIDAPNDKHNQGELMTMTDGVYLFQVRSKRAGFKFLEWSGVKDDDKRIA